MAPAPADAFGGGFWQITRTQLAITTIPTVLSMCDHQDASLSAHVLERVEFRARGSRGTRSGTFYRTPGWFGIIRATVLDPSVASVEPGFLRGGLPIGDVTFRVTGLKSGRTQIRLSSPDPTVESTLLTVGVDQCVYTISDYSEWQIPDGFRPHLYGWFDDVGLSWDASKGQYGERIRMKNEAVAPPVGGCTESWNVSEGVASVVATPERNGSLRVEITYSRVTAATRVVCGIGGGRSDTATPRPIRFQMDGSQTAYWTESGHMLNARVAIPGQTSIVVKLQRTPAP